MPNQHGPRRYVTNFNLQLGPISVTGSLTPLVNTESRGATRFPYACPECDNPTAVQQRYHCVNGHGPLEVSDLARSRELPDGTFAKLTAVEYETARVPDLTPNTLRVNVHPAGIDLIDHGTSYIFAPPVADPTFAAVIALVSDPDKTFLGVCNLRGSEGMFRLSVRGGNLVVTKVTWPAAENVFDPVNVDPDPAILEAAKGMLDRITVPYDPEDYRSGAVARAEKLTASLSGVAASPTATPAETRQTKQDLVALLETFAA